MLHYYARQQLKQQRQQLQQQIQIIRDNLDIKKLELDSLLSKLPIKKQQYFKLLFELNDYENNPLIKNYNEIERRIKLVKDKDIHFDSKQIDNMRKLVNKYKKIVNGFTLSPISSSKSSSLSPSHLEYKQLKSPSPSNLIKKLKRMKINASV